MLTHPPARAASVRRASTSMATGSAAYARIARALDDLARQVDRQPTLAELAAHSQLSPFHFQRLFSRWVGVSPKRYLQVLTVARAKPLLDASLSLLETSDRLGLSSGSRLHDHFVQLEAATPGEYKSGGAGLVIGYGVHDTPFGQAFIALTSKGICDLAFLDGGGVRDQLDGLRQRWPQALMREDSRATESRVRALFGDLQRLDKPLSLHVRGTNFQISVWKALLRIPPGRLCSYAHVAATLGNPTAARAVGRAIAANPVAFLIPCHRVIRSDGQLGGYHWGTTRKRAMQLWEVARG